MDALKRIEYYLQERKWTKYKLAKESGIAYSSLNSLFLRNHQPTIPTLEKICNGLKISMSEFFSYDIQVNIFKDHDVWVAICNEIGVFLESESYDNLLDRLAIVVPEMAQENNVNYSNVIINTENMLLNAKE